MMWRKTGFTLIETLLVIVIIAILAVVVIPRVTNTSLYNKYLAYTTAHRVAADIRLTRRLAVTKGVNYKLDCDAAGGSSDYNEYGIYEKNNGGWDLTGEMKAIPAEITVSGDEAVTFTPLGVADGDLVFNYVMGSHRYRADVKETTGRVVVETY